MGFEVFPEAMLNHITELLNLDYYTKSGKFYVCDLKNEQLCFVRNYNYRNPRYHFSIKRENGDISCDFDFSTANIGIGDHKNFFLSDGRLNYEQTDDNYKKLYVDISNNDLYFFRRNENSAESISVSFDNNSFHQMKKKIYAADSHVKSEEDLVVEDSPITFAKHNIRRYYDSMKTYTDHYYREDLYVPIDKFIQDEIAINPIVLNAISEMENAIPGILKYEKCNLPILKKLPGKSSKLYT